MPYNIYFIVVIDFIGYKVYGMECYIKNANTAVPKRSSTLSVFHNTRFDFGYWFRYKNTSGVINIIVIVIYLIIIN